MKIVINRCFGGFWLRFYAAIVANLIVGSFCMYQAIRFVELYVTRN
ncbi:hypothetical protein QZM15_32935 [Burkholderia sp. AU44665]|nr:hypothetical protein [Burkholderia sp. AU44665]MDN7703292.1 hypothetical protein [Burkholderia sp. AU44665]